ncbi:Serine/threonine-protein kinase PrkC [Thiorhodovibrio winogradskyi]|uniref:Serine/threonine-protein kinase PrkC n=1 Tax=Thiorhodovibrio winogradskyi TaxID=77007 RepID=A0ABZ0SC65_9GAMM|nr:protein kinase [Thiorhodovibrio winogradskyi]
MTTTPDQRCLGCFQIKGTANPCPQCGFDESAPRPVQALPLHTVLNQQFIVGRVLGKPGGFGITYLAWDQMLQARVAIKEYLPRELAVRAQDSRALHPHSQEETDLFRYGLEQFLNEARTLAQLDHPNLVRVRQFFEANGTAYLVMDYYQGCSLAEHLERQPGGKMREADALALMQPILDGLRAVHAKGFLHRDIKPQNIYLAQTDTGGVRPILLDFGAARQAMGERSRSLSVVISPGYAPFEQYQRKSQQTAATDIYGAAAVLYRMLTGIVPPEATDRMGDEALRPAVEFGVSEGLSNALNQALAMKMTFRPEAVEIFQQMLRQQVLHPSAKSQPPSVEPEFAPAGAAMRPTSGLAQQSHAPGSPPPAPHGDRGTSSSVRSAPQTVASSSQSKIRSRAMPPRPTPARQPARFGAVPIIIGIMGLLFLSVIGLSQLDSPPPSSLPSDQARTTSVNPTPTDAAATFALGMRYATGDGVEQDDAQAATLFREAADQGDAMAQFNLGNMYRNGRGVPQDNSQAVAWYRRAAEQGHADAQFLLGAAYSTGQSVPQDDSQAVAWFHRAAEQGHADAQLTLGLRYAVGRGGVLQDHSQAVA